MVVVRAQEPPVRTRGRLCPRGCKVMQRRRGLLAPIPRGSRRCSGAIRSASGRCGWSPGCSAG